MSESPPRTDIHVEESPPAVAADAAEMFVQLAQQSVMMAKPFRVALSGGSTPRLMCGLITSDTFRHEVPWDNLRFFFGDERWVPHSHRDSNFKLANDLLFSKVGTDPNNIFAIQTEGISPDEAAAQYADTLRTEFNIAEGEIPEFDLILLGMGDDGHTASLFPGTDAVGERKKLVVATYVDKLTAHRITLTAPVLCAAREVIFMVVGDSKAPALEQVLQGPLNVNEYPAQLLRQTQGRVTWYVDRAAAAKMSA